jgi:hypothetical protein
MAQSSLAKKARCTIPSAKTAVDVLVAGGYLEELPGDQMAHGGRAVRRFRFLFKEDAPVVYETRWSATNTKPLGIGQSQTSTVPNPKPAPSQSKATLDKPKRTQREPKTTSHVVSDDATRLCNLFAELIGARPEAKRPAVTWAWLGEMERLLKIDQRSPAKVESTIRWLDKAADPVSRFWRPNVRSPRKLRERWDQMADAYQAHKDAEKPFPSKKHNGYNSGDEEMFNQWRETGDA